MNKRLALLTAVLTTAIGAQAGVLFQEDWMNYISSEDPSSLDATRWKLDEGAFGDGLYLSSPCEYSFETYLDGNINMTAFNNTGGTSREQYWPGFSLVTVPTFTASKDEVLVIDVNRAWQTKLAIAPCKDTGLAGRAAVILSNPDKSKWLYVADNYGESGWGFNPFSGTSSDYPVNNPANIGYTFSDFNALETASDGRINMGVRVVVDGETARVYARDIDNGGDWVSGGRVIPLLLSEDINVALGAYARTPGNNTTEGGDEISMAFGALTVSHMGRAAFHKSSYDIAAYSTSEITLEVSPSHTPCTITVTSSNPDAVKLVGSTGDTLTVSFAKGESSKNIEVEGLIETGKSTLSLSASSDDILTMDTALVTVPSAPGVKLDENFDSFDASIWENDEKGYEYRSYPNATSTCDFCGVKDGKWMVENFTTVDQYWGGRGIITKRSFLGSSTTPLRVVATLDELTTPYAYEAEKAVCANLVLRNADSSSFFALRTTPGEAGWCYNKAIGAGGTAILGSKEPGHGVMELVYDGSTIKAYVDGELGATVDWVCNDEMFVEVGFYGRAANSQLTKASFSNVLVENLGSATGYTASVIPASDSPLRVIPGFDSYFMITIPAEANESEDVVMSFTSDKPEVATIDSVTFEKGGANSLFVKVNANNVDAATSVNFTADAGDIKVPALAAKVYPATQLVFSDDFSGAKLSSAWSVQERSFNGGTLESGDVRVEEGALVANMTVATSFYPSIGAFLNEKFTIDSDNPVIFEYDQGPLNGRGSIFGTLCILDNYSNGASSALVRSLSDICGWNFENEGFNAIGDGGKAKFTSINEILDNQWHTVRVVHTGSYAYFYVDGYYCAKVAANTSEAGFGLGLCAYDRNNWCTAVYDNVRVYGNLAKIDVSTAALDIDGSGSFTVSVPSIARRDGLTLNLQISDPSVAVFDNGTDTLVLDLTADSDYEQVINLKALKPGFAEIAISNSKGIDQNIETVELYSMDYGTVLFEDDLTEDSGELSSDWVIDTTPFESTNPDGAANIEYNTWYGLEISGTLSVNYWGGWMAVTKAGYNASRLSPLTIVVPSEYMQYSEGATGIRRSFRLMNADGSRWLDISESLDSSSYCAWGYNDSTINPTGGTGNYNITKAPAQYGNHTVKLVLNGKTVRVFIDDVFYKEIGFEVAENIRLGLGLYLRQAGDSGVVKFNSVTIQGSAEPLPDAVKITRQPQDREVRAGASATLSVVAEGQQVGYVWYKDGVIIDGAAGSTLTIPSVNEETVGSYYVVVSNSTSTVTSDAATVSMINLGTPVFSDAFATLDLDSTWAINTTPYEKAYPNAKGEITYSTGENGLVLDFVTTEQYWGGWRIDSQATYKPTVDNPVTILVDRTSFNAGTSTGARCSMILSGLNGEWVQFTESTDDGTYRLGYNHYVDKADGGAIIFDDLAAQADLTDRGSHLIKIVANGETVTFSMDGATASKIISFPVSEFTVSLGVYARANNDTVGTVFKSIEVYQDGVVPPVEDFVLSWKYNEEGEFTLCWPAEYGPLTVEVAPTVNGPWTALPPAELIGGAFELTPVMTEDYGFYRLAN